MGKENSTWLDIANAYERGEIGPSMVIIEAPSWLNNDFIDMNCAEIDDDEEELDASSVSIAEQLEAFYEPLYKAATKRLGVRAKMVNRSVFYIWMQEIMK